MLHEHAFPGPLPVRLLCNSLYTVAEYLIHPYMWSVDQLLCLFVPLTTELKHPRLVFVRAGLWSVPFLVLHVACIPLGVVGMLLRFVLQQMRQNYLYRFNKKAEPELCSGRYTFATMNLCLFPETPNRINNLDSSYRRARAIGERILIDQMHYKDLCQPAASLNHVGNNHLMRNHITRRKATSKEPEPSVGHHFPHLDFICFQEVWQRVYARPIIAHLEKMYPYIIYDSGHWSLKCNMFFLNSGLLFASRYPILDAEFKPYTDKCKFCIVNSKGVLMVKVLLSPKSTRNEQDVGYLFLTHLQAYEGKSKIVSKQLDQLVEWSEEYKKKTLKESDRVKFDCVLGDFNFDNMSPCDSYLQNHELFSLYDDPCRERPGVDKSWSIGTEFCQERMWDDEVSTPAALAEVLQDPVLRQRYMVDADLDSNSYNTIVHEKPKEDSSGNILLSPLGGKRRIDYILHRKNLAVATKYSLVSRLATLTDHIPVTMTLETT